MAGQIVQLPRLAVGQRDPAVLELQRLLYKCGYLPQEFMGVEQNLGPATSNAVARFQSDHKLPVTGAVDDATWMNIYAAAGEAKIVNVDPTTGASNPLVKGAQINMNTALVSTTSGTQKPPLKQISPVAVKFALFAAISGVAYYAYRKMAKSHAVDGIAFVDDGDDGAGRAIRTSARRKKPRQPRRMSAAKESSDREGLKTLNPKAKHGRKVWRTQQDEDDGDLWTEVDPGPNPSVPYKLEADERLYKAQKRYREDMRERAWDRVRANNHPVDVVVRGTKRVLYSARP